jgi:hypothetical protein
MAWLIAALDGSYVPLRTAAVSCAMRAERCEASEAMMRAEPEICVRSAAPGETAEAGCPLETAPAACACCAS